MQIVIIKENQSEGDTQKPLYINLQGKNDSITRLNYKTTTVAVIMQNNTIPTLHRHIG